MPRLMERRDWMQAVADVGTAESVWHENIAVEDGRLSLPMPESGMYHVIFVKTHPRASDEKPRKRSAKDMIGFGRRFHAPRTTDEWMKELREGEE